MVFWIKLYPMISEIKSNVNESMDEKLSLLAVSCISSVFTCIFQTFYKNFHNFWTNNYFWLKFGVFMPKYLLYRPWKCEIKIKFFGRVIENSLGGYFFWRTLYIYIYIYIYAPYIYMYVGTCKPVTQQTAQQPAWSRYTSTSKSHMQYAYFMLRYCSF